VWNEAKRRRKSILDKIDLRHFQTSTKMEALMEELYRMGEEDVGAKAIVFSQFVNMLDVSAAPLCCSAISLCVYVGFTALCPVCLSFVCSCWNTAFRSVASAV
jgi:hypothetical protein